MAYIQSNIVICSSNVLTSNMYVKYIICSLQVLTFTPDSSLSPPHQDDSEDESSFMTHTQVDLRHDGDLDLEHDGVGDGDLDHQHDGVGDGDLDQNFDMLSLLQHLVDVMEARIKQVSQIFQQHHPQSSLKDFCTFSSKL